MHIQVIQEPPGSLRQRVSVGSHTVFADISAEWGGEGSAPEPHDYFDIALATCTAQTVLIFARRRQWPLQRVEVELTRDNSEERAGHYRLELCLALWGDLTEAQRNTLLAVSDRCPVHKLMTAATVTVATHLAPAAAASGITEP